jgi:type IV pilus assembly protein PilA
MRMLHTRKRGFTLIELMIVVAIIGILAAIAIPNFMQFQLRSKTGEAKTNIAAIRTAEEGYFAEFNNYVAATETPGTAVSTNKRVWTGGGLTLFDQLGWSPTGEVFYNYGVTSTGSSYTIGAYGDLDGNGTFSDFGYVHPAPGSTAGGMAATVGGCVGAGVWDPDPAVLAPGLINTVGGCLGADGQSEF